MSLDLNGLRHLHAHIVSLLSGKVDKVDGKGLSTNDYTTAEKTKLAGIATGANKTTVDTALNSSSENPVQNKAIYSALSEKQPIGDYALKSEIPATANVVEENNLNPVSSSAVHTALSNKHAIIDVVELPETDIDAGVFYNLLTCTPYYNGIPQTAWTCYVVNTLPETGEMAYDGQNAIIYYNRADGLAYGYVNDLLSSQMGVPTGWYEGAVLVSALGNNYGGVVVDASEMTEDNTIYLILEGMLHTYENEYWKKMKLIGWEGEGSGSEIFNSRQNKAYGICSHAEGFRTIAGNENSHAEGYSSYAEGYSSHAEGHSSHAEGSYSHAEGHSSHAEGDSSHAEGSYSHAEGYSSHAEGRYSYAEGDSSHAEGYYSHAKGNFSHAEGCGGYIQFWLSGDANATTYTNDRSIPSSAYVGMIIRMERDGEQAGNEVGVTYSSAKIVAIDTATNTITVNHTLSDVAVIDVYTIGYYSGMAIGDYSHKEGNQGIALGRSQHVQGEYNVVDPDGNRDSLNARGKYAYIIGNGSSHEDRSNAYALDWNGNAYYSGDVYVQGDGKNDFVGMKKLATEELVQELIAALGLPTPTAADAGKFLRVNAQGMYELVAIPNAEEATF